MKGPLVTRCVYDPPGVGMNAYRLQYPHTWVHYLWHTILGRALCLMKRRRPLWFWKCLDRTWNGTVQRWIACPVHSPEFKEGLRRAYAQIRKLIIKDKLAGVGQGVIRKPWPPRGRLARNIIRKPEELAERDAVGGAI